MKQLAAWVLALFFVLLCSVSGIGCGSVVPAELQVGVDGGAPSLDGAHDAVADAAPESPASDAVGDERASDSQADNDQDASPTAPEPAPDAAQDGPETTCAPSVGVCYQCARPTTCPVRGNGVWVCCNKEDVMFCDSTKCTPG